MDTAIIYATNHGTTEKVAQMIHGYLNKNAELINLKTNKNPDISKFQNIIIGGSIHAGNIQKKVKKFINKRTNDIMAKKFALFLCCMDEKRAGEQFENAFPKELQEKSIYNALPGGEFRFDKMNFIERAIVKKIAGTDQNVYKVNEEEIVNLCNKFKQ